jgi:hypothetical protein
MRGAMRGARAVADLGDLAGGAGRVGLDHGREPSLRITFRHWPSAWTWLCTVFSDVAERRAGHAISWKRIGRKCSPTMWSPSVGKQMVDVGDAAGERVLDRDHREIGAAALERAKQSSKVGQGTAS